MTHATKNDIRNINIHKVDVILSSSNQKKTSGIALVQEWTQRERLKRAFKILGILWGLGLVSILIPLAHFVLVPGFLLAGPPIAFYIYQITKMIAGGKGICPNCGKEFSIVKVPLKWPLNDLCSVCQTSVLIIPSRSQPS